MFGLNPQSFTATDGQTTFTPTVPPVSNCQVYLNGALEDPGAGNDYQISGSNIVFNNGLIAGDKVRIVQ